MEIQIEIIYKVTFIIVSDHLPNCSIYCKLGWDCFNPLALSTNIEITKFTQIKYNL